jgi:hypothetical protein
MAYNYGRPVPVDESDILPHVHVLLNHPLALRTDSRTIAACELLVLRGELQSQMGLTLAPLHRLYLSDDHRGVDRALQVYNEGAFTWEVKWRDYYRTKRGRTMS